MWNYQEHEYEEMLFRLYFCESLLDISLPWYAVTCDILTFHLLHYLQCLDKFKNV